MCTKSDELCRKSDALDGGGFIFDYRHGTYVNISKKMLFSHHFVDARSAEDLEAHLSQVVPTGEWQFFCLQEPRSAMREKLIKVYS